MSIQSAVSYNKSRGYSKDTWKQIQSTVGVTADGIPGAITAQAVINWQRSHGLTADGCVGPATLGAIQKSGSTTNASSSSGNSSSASSASANFNVDAAVKYNKGRGYSRDLWKQIQTKVGTTADGDPGKLTATAIYNWQKANGLTADGQCGPATLSKMGLSSSSGGNANYGGAYAGAQGSSLASSRVDFGTKNSNERQSKVSKITIHHMAGNMGATACANMHKNGSASANYYIGSSGEICAGVAENRRAWTSSNGTNDHQAITFEVSNNSGAPDWTISDAAYNSMIALCRDICNRYGISPHFDGTPSGSLTAHYMFASTACPGPYIKGRLQNGKIEKDIKG